MTIELLPETEEIVKRALASGRFQSVDEMIVSAVENMLVKPWQPLPTAAERLAAFEAFTNSIPNTGAVVLDDSREGIYGERPSVESLYRKPLPTAQERAAAFTAFVDSLPHTGVVLERDDREAIYGDHP